jgi:hypothetical protein
MRSVWIGGGSFKHYGHPNSSCDAAETRGADCGMFGALFDIVNAASNLGAP